MGDPMSDVLRDPTDQPLSAGLVNFGLSVAAVAVSFAVCFGAALVLDVWLPWAGFVILALCCGGLFFWRRRVHFAATALAALAAGVIGLAGFGSVAAIPAAASLMILFWPITALFT
jgi:hypothetical protein